MKRKTLRERQSQKAVREEKRIERLKAQGGFVETSDEIVTPQKTADNKAIETLAAMNDIAARLGIKEEKPQIQEKVIHYYYDENDNPTVETKVDNVVEVSAFDSYRKNRNSKGYQSRDNGKLFKFYNLSMLMRIIILVSAILYAVLRHDQLVANIRTSPLESFNLLTILWLVVLIAFSSRFIPGLVKNPGYQKEFPKYFVPTANFDDEYMNIRRRIKKANRGALLVLASWVALNGVIGFLYFTNVIDEAVLVCISAFYALADVICILYYCPFQHLMMKNRCCMTCRIYNWDFMMICTPLIFIPAFYTWSLVLISLVILLRWEHVYKHHPERFFSTTNNKLRCVNCSSKLCRAKFPATATAKNLFGRR